MAVGFVRVPLGSMGYRWVCYGVIKFVGVAKALLDSLGHR